MGSIERLSAVQAFSPGSCASNTNEVNRTQQRLLDVAGRLSRLMGHMGIEGSAGLAIDGAVDTLASQIRKRSDNLEQLAEARKVATSGGEAAKQTAEALLPAAVEAKQLSAFPGTAEVAAAVMAQSEMHAEITLSRLSAQTVQAIGMLPVVRGQSETVATGGGGRSTQTTAGVAAGSAAAGYSPKATNSATAWMPQANPAHEATMGAGTRASLAGTATSQPLPNSTGFQPSTATFLDGPGGGIPAGGEGGASLVESASAGQGPVGSEAGAASAGTVQPGVAAPSEGSGLGGLAKASASAVALPAVSKALATGRGAKGEASRGTAAGSARGATPRAGATARPTGATSRSGASAGSRAASRSSATPRPGIAPRSGQGAATRAGTPIRDAAARGSNAASSRSGGTASRSGSAARSGATARSAASPRPGLSPRSGQGAATRPGTPARDATARGSNGAQQRATTKSSGGATAKRGLTGADKGKAGSSASSSKAPSRGGVTAPRKGAAPATTGRSSMGRPVTGRGGKKNEKQQDRESFTAAEMHEESMVTFIESGKREE